MCIRDRWISEWRLRTQIGKMEERSGMQVQEGIDSGMRTVRRSLGQKMLQHFVGRITAAQAESNLMNWRTAWQQAFEAERMGILVSQLQQSVVVQLRHIFVRLAKGIASSLLIMWRSNMKSTTSDELQAAQADVVSTRSQLTQVHRKAVSYTHLRAHETPEHLVCRLLLEKKKKQQKNQQEC
eukprot:TRINITY_DN64137_c0_g1_i1.p1 TRINITY_DN64137_c0_g1~~TRINITY_DN64137_c0_g1_i1.p1  ORF type:complete len:182 (-),score=54.07 TRINITY_DN64137_c0_g1_i1:23-568(-)